MFQLMSAPQARATLGLHQRTASFNSWQWEAYLEKSTVLVHQGDLHLAQDLVLDDADWYRAMLDEHGIDLKAIAPDIEGRHVSGLVVEGALAIDGALINADAEQGAFLVVAGAFEAQAVSGGGAEIRISGPARVHRSVVGHYNDGILHFNGGLTAPLVVNDDHDLHIAEPADVTLRWSSHEDSANEIRQQYAAASEGDDDVADVLPQWLARRVSPRVDRWGRLRSALISGEPALLSGTVPRVEAPDIARIAEQWDRLRLMPEAERTEALCDAAIAGSGLALLFCPRAMWTPTRVRAAVTRTPGILHGIVPSEITTPEMVFAAALATRFVDLPEALQTDDILIEVLRATKDEPDLKTLSELPAKFVTAPVLARIRALYQAHPCYGELEAERARVAGRDPFYLLTEVWQAFLSEADILRGLAESGNANAIHPSAMTPAVCDAMVSYRGSNLALLPREKVTDAHVDLALSREGTYLAYVPEEMRTPARCLAAVAVSGLALEHVPPQLITPQMCASAVEEDGRALEFVPEPMRTEAMCRRAVVHAYAADLVHVPAAYRETLGVEADAARAARLTELGEAAKSPQLPSTARMVLVALWRATFSRSDRAITSGAKGWLSTRPVLALVLSGVLGVLVLAVHVALAAYAFVLEGPLAGGLTLVLPILAEGYWAWQLWPTQPLLSVGIVILVLAHIWVRTTRIRLGRVMSRD